VRKYLKMPPRSALQLLAALGLVAGVAWLGASLLGGGGDGGGKGDDSTALAFAGTQDSWVPGQSPLTDDPLYLQIIGSAIAVGDKRLAARVRLIREIEAARKRAAERAAHAAQREAERRRREQLRALALLRAARERALRIAKAKYQAALRKAAEEKRKRAAELAAQKRKLAAQRRALEEKRRIKPGEECNFESVQQQYDCQEGRQ
jgi:hypothetical protein